MTCSRTQYSEAGEARTHGPLGLESSTLLLSHCAPYTQSVYSCTFSKVLFCIPLTNDDRFMPTKYCLNDDPSLNSVVLLTPLCYKLTNAYKLELIHILKA